MWPITKWLRKWKLPCKDLGSLKTNLFCIARCTQRKMFAYISSLEGVFQAEFSVAKNVLSVWTGVQIWAKTIQNHMSYPSAILVEAMSLFLITILFLQGKISVLGYFCVMFSRLETRITEKFNFVVISITKPLSFKDTFPNLDMQELNLHHKTCQHISLTCNRSQVGWIDGDSFGDKKHTDEIKINDPVVYMLINMVIRTEWLKPHYPPPFLLGTMHVWIIWKVALAIKHANYYSKELNPKCWSVLLTFWS